MENRSHIYVDLGLSVMWATCNVGANTPEECGDYFAWGETEPKQEYTSNNYKIKGCLEGICEDVRYDAARANWGSPWRTPTLAECQELIDNCNWQWMTLIRVNGYKVTSRRNGNYIFLPAAGRRDGVLLCNEGYFGSYLCSLPIYGSSYGGAYALLFNSDNHNARADWCYEDYGHTVRPVCETERNYFRKHIFW